MAIGPGKYDTWCTLVREGTEAQGAVLIVLNGHRGSGFAVQATTELGPAVLADLLQDVVDQLRADYPAP